MWLVGGFGTSPYLLNALRSDTRLDGITIQTPDTNASAAWFLVIQTHLLTGIDRAKAVANGAVLHFVDETVEVRMVDSNQ